MSALGVERSRKSSFQPFSISQSWTAMASVLLALEWLKNIRDTAMFPGPQNPSEAELSGPSQGCHRRGRVGATQCQRCGSTMGTVRVICALFTIRPSPPWTSLHG
jgi:hypothetical protein